MEPVLGIYEKALPQNISWEQRFSLAAECGFRYVEMSVDETDERLARLDWNSAQRMELVRARINSGTGLHSMCLSGHRRYALGSQNSSNEAKAREIMLKALEFAYDTGIRNIQLAGYDVYPDYEQPSEKTEAQFFRNLQWAVERAAEAQVMLSVEIMDTEFMSTISRWKKYDTLIASPWFAVYPDIGNVSAWNVDVSSEFRKAIDKVTAIHLKDTVAVGHGQPGVFKNVAFGSGCVDFLSFFRLLKLLNYRGSFVIEQWSEKAVDPVSEIRASRQWILEKMQLAELVSAA